jgi:hypothetical protein
LGQGAVALMPYAEKWAALAARIKGLQDAGHLYFQSSQLPDSYGAGELLRKQCLNVIEALKTFRDDFENALPVEAVTRLNDLCQMRPADAAGVALQHLQRCLIVDEELAAKWQKAYDKGETECERLGATHLLWHGIFAFKANARGGCTDLVFDEPIDTVPRGVEGLVLTEWKVADDEAAAAKKISVAREQANLYKGGVLAGIELRSYRYLIVVSQRRLRLPGDEELQKVRYRHVNIAIRPGTDSKSATKLAAKPKRNKAG